MSSITALNMRRRASLMKYLALVWTVINHIVTVCVLFLFPVLVIFNTPPFDIGIAFTVILFLMTLDLVYMVHDACSFTSKWTLFNCIPVPKFNTSILFHLAAMTSTIPPIIIGFVASTRDTIKDNTQGLFSGYDISFDARGIPNWPHDSWELVIIIIFRFSAISRVSRMEHVIRKGWGFPKPKCDANSGGCSCCCFVPPCFRCIKEEDEEDAQVNGVAHGGKETERIDTKQDSADLSSPATQSRLTKKTRKRMLRRVAGIILSLSLASAFIMFQQQARHAVLAVELYLIDQNTAASNNPVTIAARFKLLSWLSSGLGELGPNFRDIILILTIGFGKNYLVGPRNEGINPNYQCNPSSCAPQFTPYPYTNPITTKTTIVPPTIPWSEPWDNVLNPKYFIFPEPNVQCATNGCVFPDTSSGTPQPGCVAVGKCPMIIAIPQNQHWNLLSVQLSSTFPNGTKYDQSTLVFKSHTWKSMSYLSLCAVAMMCAIWVISVYSFSAPLLTFVVYPLEKVSRLFYLLRFDPLRTLKVDWLTIRERSCEICWNDEQLSGIETSSLIRALLRLAELLAVALGPTGTSFYKAVVSDGTTSDVGRTGRRGGKANLKGGLNLKGVRVSSIFMFCDIRNFTDTTEMLQGDVFRWINSIASVVHGICSDYEGNAVKHVGDAFMMVWSLPLMKNFDKDLDCDEKEGMEPCDEEEDERARTELRRSRGLQNRTASSAELVKKQNKWECQEQAEKCLIAVTKIVIALTDEYRFLVPISSSSRALLLSSGLNRVRIGFGLHAGNAIQGAIGSHLKVDVTFISKSSEIAEVLESRTKEYGVPILMSGKYFDLLGKQTKGKCRQVDYDDSKDANVRRFFTFDIDEEAVGGVKGRAGPGIYSPMTKQGSNGALEGGKEGGSGGRGARGNNNGLKGQYDPRIWVQEPTLRDVRRKYNVRFLTGWSKAFALYRGAKTLEEWTEAEETMEEISTEYADGVAERLRVKCRRVRVGLDNKEGAGN